MPAMTCYRIRHRDSAGAALDDFHDVLADDASWQAYGPMSGQAFEAQLFVAPAHPRKPDWSAFIEQGFAGLNVGMSSSPSALLIVRIPPVGRGNRRRIMFAFPFGPAGRFLLSSDAYERNYWTEDGVKCPLSPKRIFTRAHSCHR